MMTKFELINYQIKETGVDGGHKYVSATVNYKGEQRDIIIIFKDKFEEHKLIAEKKIQVEGELQDEGQQFSLTLLDSKILSYV